MTEQGRGGGRRGGRGRFFLLLSQLQPPHSRAEFANELSQSARVGGAEFPAGHRGGAADCPFPRRPPGPAGGQRSTVHRRRLGAAPCSSGAGPPPARHLRGKVFSPEKEPACAPSSAQLRSFLRSRQGLPVTGGRGAFQPPAAPGGLGGPCEWGSRKAAAAWSFWTCLRSPAALSRSSFLFLGC